jgi:hypothetical protein
MGEWQKRKNKFIANEHCFPLKRANVGPKTDKHEKIVMIKTKTLKIESEPRQR